MTICHRTLLASLAALASLEAACAEEDPTGSTSPESRIFYARNDATGAEGTVIRRELSIRIDAMQATAVSEDEGFGHLDLSEEEISELIDLFAEQRLPFYSADSEGNAETALSPACDSSELPPSEEQICLALELASESIFGGFDRPPHLPLNAGTPRFTLEGPSALTAETAELVVTLENLRIRTLEEGYQ